jgi:hypothetical protein
LRFGKNSTLVSLSASGKAQKGSKFFVVLLMLAAAGGDKKLKYMEIVQIKNT